MKDDSRKCLAAGCDGHMSKPIRREQFLSTVGECLRRPASTPDSTGAEAPPGHDHSQALGQGLLDEDTMAALLAEFRMELRTRSRGIKRAHESDNLESLSDLAHQLKGAAATYGFSRIADGARVAERLAHSGKSSPALDEAVGNLIRLCNEEARSNEE